MYRTWHNIKDETIRNKEIDYFKRFYNKWSSRNISEKDLDELNKDLFYFNCKFITSEEDEIYYDLISLNDNTMYGRAHPLMYYYELNDYFDKYNYEEFRNSLVGDYEGEDKEYFKYTIDNLIRWVLLMNEEEGTNYDGIIVPEIYDIGPKGSPFMTGKTTDIITLKSSNQIKRIDNLKPTSSNNINEDLQEIDNGGNVLSQEQIEFFKNSKVRNNKGQLVICYHSTDADFDVFDDSKFGEHGNLFGDGFYFSTHSDNIYAYGSKYKVCYLNIVKPYNMTRDNNNEEIAKELIKNYCGEYDEEFYNKVNKFDPLGVESNVLRYIQIKTGKSTTFTKVLKASNYDGVIADNLGEIESRYAEIVAFNPNQIKSITNKNPTSSNNINENDNC